MKVKPKMSYELLGTSIKLDENKTYRATHARNQPDWRKKGLIFVKGILLERGEYTIIKDFPAGNIDE